MELTYDWVISKFRCWTQLNKQSISSVDNTITGEIYELGSEFLKSACL